MFTSFAAKFSSQSEVVDAYRLDQLRTQLIWVHFKYKREVCASDM